MEQDSKKPNLPKPKQRKAKGEVLEQVEALTEIKRKQLLNKETVLKNGQNT